jgi:hypothetical protein
MLAQDVTHAMPPSQQQKARSFELRAALSLASSIGVQTAPPTPMPCSRSALEGFSPTPEFPEIAEAKTLLAMLAQLSSQGGDHVATVPADSRRGRSRGISQHRRTGS